MAATKRRWTKEEYDYLRWNWGSMTPTQIGKHLGRTRVAIIRMAVVRKLGGMQRGTKSMAQFVRETGFQQSTILNIASNLGLKLRRLKRCDRAGSRPLHYSIDIEQEERIIAYLKENRQVTKHLRLDSNLTPRTAWGTGKKPACCHRCKGTAKPHFAKGYCKPCFGRAWGLGERPKRCLGCQSDEFPHHVGGRCQRCVTALRHGFTSRQEHEAAKEAAQLEASKPEVQEAKREARAARRRKAASEAYYRKKVAKAGDVMAA